MHLGRRSNLFYAGELKKFNRSFHARRCTCGEAAKDCDFWGPLISQEMKYFNRGIDKDISILLFVKNMKSLFFGNSRKLIEEEKAFLENLAIYKEEKNQAVSIMIDSSKSLNRLVMYREMKDLEVYTIYLERDLRANIASFVKRGNGVLNSYLRLKINGALIKRYLSRNKINHIKIKYEDFISQPEETIQNILHKFNIKDEGVSASENETVHLISGNEKTRFRTTTGNYKIDQSANLQDPFSNWQKNILRLLGI
ncbi:hypothetical protein GCM10007940_21880 [Portibacter lacus]|uniref:Sulfotransferase domain-containing protein n=2 Tax=Portibacter lacus TaxID=1099794 RepID=A0AA37SMM6_9BACT|nr:hypothetical protein GCM10007940_21880 [Portibacter lacus]